MIKNEFQDQNYTREYYILGYSLDFAWVDKKNSKLKLMVNSMKEQKIKFTIKNEIKFSKRMVGKH